MGRAGEEGFLLVGVILMVALVLLVLSVAAPIVAKDLRRERELEAVHRAQQYTRAIRLYYQKFNSYPASVKQLEKTNNVRYLRQHYLDPMTGKDDWRLIGFGQAKTTVKGFFGQPLAGLGGGGGLGSASGLQSPGQSGTTGQPGGSAFGSPGSASSGSFGSASGGQAGSTFGGQSGGQSGALPVTGGGATAGSTTGGTSDPGSSDAGPGGSGGSAFGSSSFGSGSGSSSSPSGFSGSSGPFVGIGLPKEGPSIIELNEQTDYSKWEFLYDPRIEQLYSKVSLFGGGPASTSSGSLGSASGLASPNGGNGAGTTGTGTETPGSSNDAGSSGATGATGTTGSTGTSGQPPSPQPQ